MTGGSEITVLALGGLLVVAQYVLMAVPANLQLGPAVTTGPRDTPLALTGVAGRLHRALGNMHEALLLYAVAAVSVTLLDATSGLTAVCAWVWFGARVAYVPCYALGLSPWRSIAFVIGFGAATLMLIAALV
ncbi:MAPEG family protein [Paroceanicella profunda]|uniref:MAPEG family protein n=1 Tax=Paroceanicella profunda TaxID=2579971 RepID=A0A5B8FGA4_9RHOB|nr:MAPEG family protein [Paroceanicella profunda]QDL90951.1 MAPEG family protein [Paroceanicella profunda]